MPSSIAYKKKDNSVPSSIQLFVALYLIMLAFFIILTKDLSFDDYKQTTAMHSIYKTFGKPKSQKVLFGKLEQTKIEDFAGALENLFKDDAKIIVSANGERFRMEIDKSYLYYADEVSFRLDRIEQITEMRNILRQWSNKENPIFTASLSQENYALDKKRISYFTDNFNNVSFNIGIDMNESKKLVIKSEKRAR